MLGAVDEVHGFGHHVTDILQVTAMLGDKYDGVTGEQFVRFIVHDEGDMTSYGDKLVKRTSTRRREIGGGLHRGKFEPSDLQIGAGQWAR